MKTLPDSPSLEHLRQQAKDLLPQLQAVRPGATLSQAQAVLAEQYGYRTWPDLKAEVDRRTGTAASGGDDDDERLAAALAAAFGLGDPVGPLVPYERQWAGRAWTFTTDGGRWLARRLFDWGNDPDTVEVEVRLAESASAAGIAMVRPVRTATGAIVQEVADARWRIFELVPFGPAPSMPADPRHARAAGRIIATIHGLGIPAPGPMPVWLTRVIPRSRWEELHRAADADGRPWADRFAAMVPALIDLGRIVEPLDPGAKVILTGGYYGPGAMRTAGPDNLVVLGWDHPSAVTPLWDLGGAVGPWASGVAGTVNREAVRALVDGYAESAELPRPLGLGIFSAAVCAHLNWIASRVNLVVCAASDPGRREEADRSVLEALADPPSRASYEALLEAMH